MRYAVFLRSINVGTHNRIKMPELISLFGNAGIIGARTYLQSGNAIFESDADAAVLSAAIEQVLSEHGLRNTSPVLRTIEELKPVAESEAFEPFPDEAFTRFVLFASGRLPQQIVLPTSLSGLQLSGVREREILIAVPKPQPNPVSFGGLETRLGVNLTGRYWHVVRAVYEMACT